MKNKILAKDRPHLEHLIQAEIILHGYQCNLNHIDISKIINLGNLFAKYSALNIDKFNGDISQWDVSRVEDMRMLFEGSEFNGDISQWNVSNVKNMYCMFAESKFNGDIVKWDVSNVEHMSSMFEYSQFEHNLSEWKPFKLDLAGDIFVECNAPVPYWSNYNNNHDMVDAINKYLLYKEMNNNLDIKSAKYNKVKI